VDVVSVNVLGERRFLLAVSLYLLGEHRFLGAPVLAEGLAGMACRH
jgi:hypothetical protein